MTRHRPLHRHLEDVRIDYDVRKRRYLRDGVLDITEAMDLIGFVEERAWPMVDLTVERDEHLTSCIVSPLGIRGQRPTRTWNAAQRRPLPANMVDFEERLRERDGSPVPAA